MCKVADCQGKPVAKGLCAKHYMRARRCGDPEQTRKRGPKPLFDDFPLSPRSRVRFKQAIDLLRDLDAMGVYDNALDAAFERAKRRNGTINVTALLAAAEDMWQRVIDEQNRGRWYQFRPDGNPG
jgi:hypothetical protein